MENPLVLENLSDIHRVTKEARCPGYYCGRYEFSVGNISTCGSCPRGSRVNGSFMCVPCTDAPVFYDWLYLIFMVMVPVIFQSCYIDVSTRSCRVLRKIHLSVLIEVLVSAVATILLMEPMGTLSLKSCNVLWLSDWYTLLYNPSPYYEDTIYCTQEAVYPLYSMIFVFYGLNIIMLIIIRPWFIQYSINSYMAYRTLYAGLYLFPILALIHAVLGGIIYYSFPYITLMLSMIVNAVHYADILDQSALNLIKVTFSNFRGIVVIFGVWICNAFAIIGVTQLTDPLTHCLLLGLAPLPTVFYIITARFTDPHKFHTD